MHIKKKRKKPEKPNSVAFIYCLQNKLFNTEKKANLFKILISDS